MIIFLTGVSARQIKLIEIRKEYSNIKVYDANIKQEYQDFLDNIFNISIFSNNELVILKRSEKLKDIKSLIKHLESSTADIVIDYDYNSKTKNPYIKDFENIGCQIIDISNADDILVEYIMNNLSIKKTEAIKLIEKLGKDFNHIQNEIFKIKSLNDENINYDDIIMPNLDLKIYEYVEKIIDKKIEFDNIPKEYYMSIIYSLYKEFETFHKISLLDLSSNYDTFKKEYENYTNIFNSNYYSVYLKLKKKYTEKKSLKILVKINEYETKIKKGNIDEKTALWLIMQEI